MLSIGESGPRVCGYTLNYSCNLLYFSDYKMNFLPQIWEENGGASYTPNVAYLASGGGGGGGAGPPPPFSSSKT